MADPIFRQRLIDIDGLKLADYPERWFTLWKDIGLQLALMQAMGPAGAVALGTDAAGSLKVTIPAATVPPSVAIQDYASTTKSPVTAPVDAQAGFAALAVFGPPMVFNGTQFDRQRSAAAANLAAQSGLGVALTALPGQWAVTSQPAAGVQASASRAAGGAGVRHVCTGIHFSAGSLAAPVATQLSVRLLDGASGVGATLAIFVVTILAAAGQNVAPFGLTGLNIVGSAATAMTFEFNSLLANLSEAVGISGYDAS